LFTHERFTQPGSGMTRLRYIICTFLCLAFAIAEVPAQQNSQIKALLNKFRNWRYGMVSVFRVNEEDGTVTKLNMLLGPAEPALSDDAKLCKPKEDIENLVLTGGEGFDEKEQAKLLNSPGCKAYERYYSSRLAWERAQFKKAFVVTTRRIPGEPYQIIGLLTQKTTESYYGLRQDLDPPSDVYLADPDLRKSLDDQILVSGVAKKGKEVMETSASTLYEYLDNQLLQGNFENVTPEAQGIGEEGIQFVKKKYGVGELLDEDDSPMYIRITEGLPQDYQNNNEIIVSVADGVSYRRYERPVVENSDPDSTKGTNDYLPVYGLEVKYGLDDINYPSLWSERLAVNAIWSASRLGIVLPTSGWAALATELGNTRKLTSGGFGINGSFDFPIRIIMESGVFNVAGSYVFDDANKSEHQTFDVGAQRYHDYMVRFHGTIQYSFATKIDKDFMFRLRLGGTVYNMETWGTVPDSASEEPKTIYKKVNQETVGGISGRVDFMTTSWSTPVGFSLSYFDETILSTAWLQVPIIPAFAVRADVRVFTPVFRDKRIWENNAVVMPAIKFIFNF